MVTNLFSLKRSAKFSIQNNQAVRVDLGLTVTPSPPRKEITGQVTHWGQPIPNATVVVLDAQLNPVTYTQTNQDGIYLIAGLNSQLYGLTATAPDFFAADIIWISLVKSKITIANIELQKSSRCVFYWTQRGINQSQPPLCGKPT
ncbi:MAG: carboxypeptidase-like regulatory domain-containing protein [Bacillota bacterium]|jgi:hypothetical protein